MLRSIKPFSVGFRSFTAAAQIKPRLDIQEGVAPAPLTQLNEEELALKETGRVYIYDSKNEYKNFGVGN
jgi:hypothetical protein